MKLQFGCLGLKSVIQSLLMDHTLFVYSAYHIQGTGSIVLWGCMVDV